MDWVKLPHECPCETCGTAVQHWVRQMGNGHRTVEITFCPMCSLEVKAMVEAEALNRLGSAQC